MIFFNILIDYSNLITSLFTLIAKIPIKYLRIQLGKLVFAFFISVVNFKKVISYGKQVRADIKTEKRYLLKYFDEYLKFLFFFSLENAGEVEKQINMLGIDLNQLKFKGEGKLLGLLDYLLIVMILGAWIIILSNS